MGSEGQDVYDHLPDTEAEGLNDYEISIAKLDKHYLPKISTILERYHFGNRTQNDGETVESYVTSLRKLASSCKFETLTAEHVRDLFMLGCNMERVREEL